MQPKKIISAIYLVLTVKQLETLLEEPGVDPESRDFLGQFTAVLLLAAATAAAAACTLQCLQEDALQLLRELARQRPARQRMRTKRIKQTIPSSVLLS